MSRPRKIALIFALLVTLLGAIGGWRVYRLYNPVLEDVLPEFTERPEGPRAPKALTLGVEIGKSTLPEVRAMLDEKGIRCEDTSVRMLIAAQREAKKAEIERVRKEGGDVDAVSGASMIYYRSPKEANPQVRWTCQEVRADQMGDRERPVALGRWLFVFDSPDHPVRSVSYRRSHRRVSAALADFLSAEGAMTATFGAPTTSKNRPLQAKDVEDLPPGQAVFPRYTTILRQWDYADVVVKVTALNYGARGIDILEAVEVPWPVRADAPTLP